MLNDQHPRSLGVDIKKKLPKKIPFGAFGLNFMIGDVTILSRSKHLIFSGIFLFV